MCPASRLILKTNAPILFPAVVLVCYNISAYKQEYLLILVMYEYTWYINLACVMHNASIVRTTHVAYA